MQRTNKLADPNASEEVWVKAADIMDFLDISRSTLDRLRASGSIAQPTRFDGIMRWQKKDVLAYIRRAKESQPSAA